MIPEEGKRYYLRYGGVSGVLRKNGCSSIVWTDGLFTWVADGSCWHNEEAPADLIREYIPDPQPLEWKRGIPTEEECRECWIVDGYSGDVPPNGISGRYYTPGLVKPNAWTADGWYLALRVKPVEPPKPKTVTLCKLVHKNGAELWWPHGVPFATFDDWTETGEKKEAEVPA